MKPSAADAKAVPALVERFERALGPALTTPELVAGTDGRQVRADYRVWRWECPCCSADDSDPERLWRPLFIDSDGRVACERCHATGEQIGNEIRIKLDAIRLFEGLGIL